MATRLMTCRVIGASGLTIVMAARFGGTSLASSPARDLPVLVRSGASSQVTCNRQNLAKVHRGASIAETVRLGGETAKLTAVSYRGSAVQGESDDAAVRHGKVVVHDSGGHSSTYRLPTNRFYRPRAEYLADVDANPVDGYLCLVRFHSDQNAVAVVAVNPGCMGGCPVLKFIPSRGHRRSLQVGPGGSTIESVNGAPVVVTDDYRFFGQFADDAESLDPVRVFTIDHGRLRNIASRFPARLRRDAAQDWRFFSHPGNGPHTGLGALAAWAGDECSLGRQTFETHKVQQLLTAGRLKGSPGSPGGRRFVRHLHRFLKRTGYAH
jgi:hypothetical protein